MMIKAGKLTVAFFVLMVAYAVGGPFNLDSDEFPIGMFSVDSEQAMKDVSKMGIKYIHSYRLGCSDAPKDMKRYREYLDNAQKYGLKVMYHLAGDKLTKQEDGIEKMVKIVNTFKSHPAFGCWYLYDEPEPEETLLPSYYQALKKIMPDSPVIVAQAWTAEWPHFVNSAMDLLMIDHYPVYDRNFPKSRLELMTIFTDKAIAEGKPVIPINQSFNWKILAGDKKVYRDRPTANFRYPNTQELRYWCYSGLTQGVRGMFWWSHTRSIQYDKNWMPAVFSGVMLEFRDFVDLVSPAHKPFMFERVADKSSLMAMWERPSGSWLVLVNKTPKVQKIARSTNGKIENKKLIPWGKTQKVNAEVVDGKILVKAKPWEVFIWEVKADDKGVN
ncbi:MAG: hypothetical protein J7K65_08420 [Planctomycetes bacterium]|nr:hypothetical protein [Planctomycetota bacterium]